MFGWCAVDFVCEDDLREDWALLEAELAGAGAVVQVRLDEDGGARNVGGHEVRGELDPAETQVERSGERADEECFTKARHAFEEDVPVAEQAGEHTADDLGLADDCAGDLRADRFVVCAESFDRRPDVGRGVDPICA